jgi:hypothetical protein
VIVTVPTDTPVTSPLASTVAVAAEPLDHVTAQSVTTAPLSSLTVAVSCTVSPTSTDAGFGVTATLAMTRRVSVESPPHPDRTRAHNQTAATGRLNPERVEGAGIGPVLVG